jgi:predicted MFS family arabinose efflux permease
MRRPGTANERPGLASQVQRGASRVARATSQHLEQTLGGRERTRVIVALACVLALSSADSATVGASAAPLRTALHIGNTDIGLLVTVSSLVAAVASLPFGVIADRWRRTRTLGLAVGAWGVAMLWSATASSFDRLLLSRLALGVVTAAAGPIVASLVGDYFEGAERGRIYSYILTGELAGAGIGFAVTGDLAALSWRASFVLLALPAFALAWFVLHLPEPERGGRTPLRPEGSEAGTPTPVSKADDTDSNPTPTDAQVLASSRGVEPEEGKVLEWSRLGSMKLIEAARAVLSIRTNVILIVASACGYFYLSGVETFAAEFVKQQYRIDQFLANLLLLVLGGGAIVGVLLSGNLSDRLLKRGFLNARIVVAAIAALAATVLFIPALTTRSAPTAVPYLTLAAFMLSAQNPPIDAARLDIVPALLWGRAEAIRTLLRSLAQSLAPVTFGVVSDHVFGGGRSGLQWTFGLMLVSMGASGVILLRATRTYPRDVATAAASVPPVSAEAPTAPAADPSSAAAPPPDWPAPAPPHPPVPPEMA